MTTQLTTGRTTTDHPSGGGSAPPSRHRRTPALVAVTLVVAALVLAWTAPRRTDTRTEVLMTDPERIVVDVNGRVSVAAGDETSVTVEREWAWVGAPDTSVDLENGVLHVRGRCGVHGLVPGRCLTHVNATVARGTEVAVTTSAGTVSVTGTTGGVDLRTSAGRVDVTDVAGPARLHSSAGAIAGTVNGGDVNASTAAGSIALDVTGDPGHLSATSRAGGVTLTVPDHTYAVDFDTSAGDVELDVRIDLDATRRITARSSAGDITIRRTAQ